MNGTLKLKNEDLTPPVIFVKMSDTPPQIR